MIQKMIITVIILATILVPLYSQSESDYEVRQNTDNTITITRYNGTIKNVIIPSTLYGLKVTAIGDRAFLQKELTSVIIPDTVITIGVGAFSGNSISTLKLPSSLKTIGDEAFAFNKTILNITFNNELQDIGKSAFSNSNIVELNLPSSLRIIKDSAFESNRITKLTFGNGLQTIGSRAFYRNNIGEINLPSSLREIGSNAFSYNQIQTVIIPNGATSIGSGGVSSFTPEPERFGVFSSNPITSVVIPASLSNGYIWAGTFGRINGNSIIRITIPERMNENLLRGCFEEAFINYWINQNRTGGTYIKRGPIWNKVTTEEANQYMREFEVSRQTNKQVNEEAKQPENSSILVQQSAAASGLPVNWKTEIETGANSELQTGATADFSISKETIQGQEKYVLILESIIISERGIWKTTEFSISDESFIQRLRTANGVRFKVQGNVSTPAWNVGITYYNPSHPSADSSGNRFYIHNINIKNNNIVNIDIQFSRNLGKANIGNINSFVIQRRYDGDHRTSITENSTIKIFDFEIY